MEFSIPNLKARSVEIGLSGLIILDLEESETEQVGYSVSIKGEPLFGFNDGDWQEGWYVIGRETSCGDPIFVDLNDPDIPVYTAAHGMGFWEEVCIADSYENFEDLLDLIDKSIVDGKLSSGKIRQIIKLVGNNNSHTSMEFWQTFLGARWWQKI